VNDDYVKMQFFKAVALENKLKYSKWLDPETTEWKLIGKKLPLPSFPQKEYQEEWCDMTRVS
jgi:hypothetical protein